MISIIAYAVVIVIYSYRNQRWTHWTVP